MAGPSARNAEMCKLRAELSFASVADAPPDQPAPPTNVDAHDAIVWCGDLNYRVAMDDDKARARALRDSLRRAIHSLRRAIRSLHSLRRAIRTLRRAIHSLRTAPLVCCSACAHMISR